MNDSNWKIRIAESPFDFNREVYIYRHIGDQIEIMGGDSVTRTYGRNESILKTPTLLLSPEALQALSNALNEQGYKPQEGFVEGKLEATEKHLEDMRTLVFKNK